MNNENKSVSVIIIGGVLPGGGLPTGIMSGKRLVKTMCKADGKKFTTIL